jgi:hypothetical protein
VDLVSQNRLSRDAATALPPRAEASRTVNLVPASDVRSGREPERDRDRRKQAEGAARWVAAPRVASDREVGGRWVWGAERSHHIYGLGPAARSTRPTPRVRKTHDTAIKRRLVAACPRITGWGERQLPVGPHAEDLVREVRAGDLAQEPEASEDERQPVAGEGARGLDLEMEV